jgi:DNA replication protein DnaC
MQPDLLKNPAVCPSCGGTGWEVVEEKGVRPCECKRAFQADVLLTNARIPRRFQGCSFDNFTLPPDPINPSICNNSVQWALITSKKYVEEFMPGESGLLYLGTCGVGKTHLAVAVLKELIRKGIPGLFYDFRDLLKEIQDSYNPNTKASELQVLTPVFDAEVLVLDELGASKPTEWVQETITHIINKRYNDRKVTLFTSNYQDISIGSAYEETLTDRVGVRLRSRLHEMCRQILIEGSDYREVIKKDRRRRNYLR